jgi:serine protease Do
VDVEGRLVGINTAIVSPSGGNNGIGFAVPINMARNVLVRLVSGGKVTRGYLGIIPQDIDADLAKQFNLPDQNGALVGDVMAGTPAAKAGIKSGDVITAINGQPVADAHGLQLTVSQISPGTPVAVKVIRNGVARNFTVTLAELPGGESVSGDDDNSSTGTGMADALDGVTVADLEPSVREQLRVPADINGALVSDVSSDSNSADAGLQANDLIVEINRQPVTSADDAVRLCKAARGEHILVKIWRRNGDFAGTRYLSVDNTKRAK